MYPPTIIRCTTKIAFTPSPKRYTPIPSLTILFKIPAWYLPGKSTWSSLLSGSLWVDYLTTPNRARIHRLWAMWRREWKTGPLLEKQLPFEKNGRGGKYHNDHEQYILLERTINQQVPAVENQLPLVLLSGRSPLTHCPLYLHLRWANVWVSPFRRLCLLAAWSPLLQVWERENNLLG